MKLHFLLKLSKMEISGQLGWRIDQDILWSRSMKAGMCCQMDGPLTVSLLPAVR